MTTEELIEKQFQKCVTHIYGSKMLDQEQMKILKSMFAMGMVFSFDITMAAATHHEDDKACELVINVELSMKNYLQNV